MRNFFWIILLCLGLTSCTEQKPIEVAKLPIIPKPQSLEYKDGFCSLSKNVGVYYDASFPKAANVWMDTMKDFMDLSFSQEELPDKASFVIVKDESIPPEGYVLEIGEQITIRASDPSGAFWAVQTFRQMLPNGTSDATVEEILIPKAIVTDHPSFRYRGMHLDVGRHFFDKEFIKEYISYLSMLKMNYFHWHLTEDQGWRIEILQYPNLTKHGAYREETLIGHYNDTPQQFDGKRYGGYYTQEEVKEIVAFAESLNVTIIPEIEMPGHAQAAISAYPQLGCTGEQVPVATKWGVFENIYCPKEETFIFLKNVLTEVMDLFPGEYIHIGGDEAPKTQWKNCDHCQQLIADLGLKDEHELQSYFIKEIETFVNSKGKKIIGWDEILEGGLAPNATVMSWRGTQGAVQAAKEGHDVILTPTSHAYFDYYQAEHADEPLAIGGFLPLKKVYSFNPIPEGLTQSENKYVLGAQGNVWTEYMPAQEQVEYMAFPRMLAMSEVVWSGPSEDLEKDYPEFLSRVEGFLPRLEGFDINYANHLYDVSGEILKRNDSVYYQVNTSLSGKEIKYSVNSEPSALYSKPIPIVENSKIEAAVVLSDSSLGRSHTAHIQYHKVINADISVNVPPHQAYSAGGKGALINGISGSDSRYGDKEWLGFWGDDLEITIQLPEPREISTLSTRFYHAPGQWIYSPNHVATRVELEDGTVVANKLLLEPNDSDNLTSAEIGFSAPSPIMADKIILMIPNYGIIPQGKQGEGNKAWTFIDEIIVE
ncbi:beta-N-acetylhexosaminidase [Aureisphaera galaxeae]|uniref:beta-N-acetylhexosaminidase n=1 Tax=Aureisphaera galaxeae TaxID=1538023 RepID=UPI0023502406|nr:beta-N-acetylhexosaminidase [Aureisphaera galaxeae]MDC8005260.1 beta-N-acetylhexosaminidase [Aureisphaera galaxeae]